MNVEQKLIADNAQRKVIAPSPKRLRFEYRKLFWKWHKYAGLIGGPLFVLIALTGSILVFSPEIDDWLRPDVKTIPAPSTNSPHASDQAMVDLVQNRFPDEPIVLYWQSRQHNHPYEFWLISKTEKGVHEIWVNPYSGEIVGDRMRETAFIRIVEQLHRRLLTGEIGSSIVEFMTGWGIVLTLTGVFMWWPKTRKGLRHGLTIPLRGSAYKINWRLHNTIGAWSAVFVLLMCLTGMVFSTYSGKLYQALLAATGEPLGAPAPKSTPASDRQTGEIDPLLEIVRNDAGEDQAFVIQWPRTPTACFVVSNYREARPEWADRHHFRQWHFDQYTGELLAQTTWSDLHPMLQFRSLSMTIHYGSIFGLPTKLIAIFACLMVPLLTVSGYLIWWWKRKNRKLSASRPQRSKLRAETRETAAMSRTLVACLITVGIIFPTIGLSYLALLVWEILASFLRSYRRAS
ncbi:PepSY domain-containing protein [Blastopirellula sp. J2-11]|uniref:PepSY-associated TM helix domain-containing protein n=1 Tax=Blastopirellula sp. J2-11 TaxID=2943192 RepID=UPI0021C7B066|nr:PepSY domain-containing protein [Blastopirellula sp. J2-11]UUO08816.1 PepSY domain-containing protein [Blastopirellula sp. J2-11]